MHIFSNVFVLRTDQKLVNTISIEFTLVYIEVFVLTQMRDVFWLRTAHVTTMVKNGLKALLSSRIV